jgi:signal peptidase II
VRGEKTRCWTKKIHLDYKSQLEYKILRGFEVSVKRQLISRTVTLRFVQALVIGIVVVWVALDQALKAWVVGNIPLNTYDYVQAIPGFLSLAHVTNTGAAWSLFSGATPVLIAVRIVVGAAILIWVLRHPKQPMVNAVAYSLIVGGAFGNAIDGLLRGHVVDMLQSHWLSAVYRVIGGGNIFPIFNIADIGVVSGVILLIIASLIQDRKRARDPLTPIR